MADFSRFRKTQSDNIETEEDEPVNKFRKTDPSANSLSRFRKTDSSGSSLSRFRKTDQPTQQKEPESAGFGDAIVQSMKDIPIVGPLVEPAQKLKRHFTEPYTPEEIAKETAKGRKYTKKRDEKYPDVIDGQPIKWVDEPIAFYKGENGDILNYRVPEDKAEIDKRMKSGERFYPSPPPKDFVRKKIPMKTGKATGELETPMIDPVTDFTFGAGFGAKTALKKGLTGGQVAKAAIKEGLDELTFGVGGTAKDVMKGAFKGLKQSKIARPLKEKLINDWQLPKEYFNYPGIKKTTVLDPVEVRKLMFKRTGNQTAKVEDIVKKIEKDRLSTGKKLSKKFDIDPDKFKQEVNDYLVAKHAPDYNLEHGDKAAKFSTEEAENIVKRVESSPYGKEVKRVANEIKSFHDETLDLLYQGGDDIGLITKEQYDVLKNKYKNHVPLYRDIKKDEDIFTSLSGSGYDVKGSGLMAGKGSDLDIKDILENTYLARVSAIQRVEKNIVDNATYKSVQDFMNSFQDQEVFDIVKPKISGYDLSGKPTFKKPEGPNVLEFRLQGKPAYIQINDSNLAAALKGVNREQVHKLLKYVSVLPRYVGRMATQYNPAFAPANKLRDLPEALVYLASRPETSKMDIFKAGISDWKSSKDVIDYMRGKNTKGTKLYEELMELGGAGGGNLYGTREQLVKSFDKIVKENRSNPRKLLAKTLEGIEKWNNIFEDSTRLTVFKTLRKKGIDPKKAAVIAKDASIDFDQMGQWGPMINSLYLFSNPSMQGTYKTAKALSNPKVLAGTTLALATPIWVTNSWNDKTDPEWRKKVSEWDRQNGLNIVLPTKNEFHYIHIPTSYGLKPLKNVIDKGYDLANGINVDVAETTKEIMQSAIDSWSPVSAPTVTQAITPSVARPFVDPYGFNRSYTGFKIHKEDDKHDVESIKHFQNLENTVQGKLIHDIADKASDTTGGRIEINPADISYVVDQYLGGGGRFAKQVISSGVKAAKGEMPEPKEIPFASRFWRKTDPEFYRDATEEKLARKLIGNLKKRHHKQDDAFRDMVDKTATKVVDFVNDLPLQDRDRFINSYVDTMVQGKMSKDDWRKWYEKLKYMPPEVRRVIFEYRKEKSSPKIQRTMDRDAALFKIFSDSYFTSEIPE